MGAMLDAPFPAALAQSLGERKGCFVRLPTRNAPGGGSTPSLMYTHLLPPSTHPTTTDHPQVGLRDSTLPRQIRARNALVPVGKRARHHKKDTGSPHTPPSPHQEAVANALTKRVALGPW